MDVKQDPVPPARPTSEPFAISKRRFANVQLPSVLVIAALWIAFGALTLWDFNSEMRTARASATTLADALSAHTVRVLREAEQVAAFVSWQVPDQGVRIALAAPP